MASCDYCGTTILFGGQLSGAYRFCNQQCASKGALVQVANKVPSDVVQQQMWSLRQAPCPVCKGPGPVDVHTSYRVYSVLIMTSWRNQPRLSCRSCGGKAKVGDALVSLVAGWWGFPWGLIMTPIQFGRNVVGIMGSDTGGPSPQLEKMVRTMIAAAMVQRAGRPSTP